MRSITLALIVVAALPLGCRGRATPTASPPPATPPPVAQATAPAEPALPPGHPPVSGGGDVANAPDMPPGGEAIAGTVTIAPALRGRVSAADVLFVVARNAGGQIVAVRKQQGVQLPYSFQLSSAEAMSAGVAFEGPMDITARVSKTGDAMPARGDIEGVAKAVSPGANDVTVVLDTVRQ